MPVQISNMQQLATGIEEMELVTELKIDIFCSGESETEYGDEPQIMAITAPCVR